jgi:hypothetical protein
MRIVIVVLALFLAATPSFGQAAVIPGNAPPPALTGDIDFWFTRLTGATNVEDAAMAENEIQRLWLQSGSVTVDLVMRWALEATQAGVYSLALISSAADRAPATTARRGGTGPPRCFGRNLYGVHCRAGGDRTEPRHSRGPTSISAAWYPSWPIRRSAARSHPPVPRGAELASSAQLRIDI